MKKTETSRIHFAPLVIGTAYYLFAFPGLMSIRNGVPEANIPDIETFFKTQCSIWRLLS